MKLPRSEVQRRQRTKSGILNESEVAYIKWQIEQGENTRTLARNHDVSLWTIRAIARGDTWGWVKPVAGAVPIPEERIEATAQRLYEMQQQEDILNKLTTAIAEDPITKSRELEKELVDWTAAGKYGATKE